MRIILTNDDGFDALGINTVKEILQKYGEVYTFAPLHPQSGKSAGFTTYRKPIQVYQQDQLCIFDNLDSFDKQLEVLQYVSCLIVILKLCQFLLLRFCID